MTAKTVMQRRCQMICSLVILSRPLTFLGTTEERPILLQVKVDLDKVGTGEELHDHSRRDNGRDTKFHESTSVGSENDPHPVERVGRVGRHDSIERNLRRNQEDG